ncbi:MAG: hypothetical protein MNPFHGCM_01395 [Gemmatimonadaceae bacterium]|nr:hypothetical protein [Gemmatimonadaceae bacterium]
MTHIESTGLPGAPARTPDDARLVKAARQLEGVFVQQLFKAMRETVPREGALDGGSGEEMFTALMDEQFADRLPSQWHHGIGESLVRQLRTALSRSSHASPSEVP